eukprot:gene274-5841_t
MREQHSRMEHAIDVAEQIAADIAQYDTDAATDRVLRDGGDVLPYGLRLAFERIIGNLAAYKPFIPHSVLTRGAQGALMQDAGADGSDWGSSQ